MYDHILWSYLDERKPRSTTEYGFILTVIFKIDKLQKTMFLSLLHWYHIPVKGILRYEWRKHILGKVDRYLLTYRT